MRLPGGDVRESPQSDPWCVAGFARRLGRVGRDRRGIGESGRPRGALNPEIVGSNPAAVTNHFSRNVAVIAASYAGALGAVALGAPLPIVGLAVYAWSMIAPRIGVLR